MKHFHLRILFLVFFAPAAGSFSGCQHEPSVAPAPAPASAPTNLVYAPNALTLSQGTAGSSAVPKVSGSGPITYTLSSSPGAAGLTVNATTGMISASNQLPAGTYASTVTATNPAGSTSFANAFALTVSAAPTAISFATHVQPLISSACGGCHTAGGGNTNYTVYANAAGNIASVLNRVMRAPSTPGYMPQNRPPLTAAQLVILQQWQAQGLQP